MKLAPLHLGVVGLACPLGHTWASVCAAIRAGISRRRLSEYRDDQGREISASYDPNLAPEVRSDERWLVYLTRALHNACAGKPALLERAVLVLSLPTSNDDRPYTTIFVRNALSARLGVDIPAERIYVTNDDHGSLAALRQASEIVRGGRPCIVAAADSLLSARRLLTLATAHRLLVEGNSDGIVPGEAAAAVVLSSEPQSGGARLLGLGLGREPSRLDNDVPLRAEGLVVASRMALDEAGLGLQDLDFRISDAAGESFFFKEQALLVARLLRTRKPAFPLWLPAENLGDCGVAAGLCGILVAMAAWARGYAPGPRALICTGDGGGARAAAVLESTQRKV